MFIASLWCVWVLTVEAAVLDPSLYLSPSPPLTDTADSISPAVMWSRIGGTSGPVSELQGIDEKPTSRRKPQPMEKAKLFWPTSQPQYSLGTVQIPLTFGLSGTYGKYAGNVGMGIIGSSYANVANAGDAAAGAVSALAGSSYGSYGSMPSLRIYGREVAPSWSGWGNGKWGHYGKG